MVQGSHPNNISSIPSLSLSLSLLFESIIKHTIPLYNCNFISGQRLIRGILIRFLQLFQQCNYILHLVESRILEISHLGTQYPFGYTFQRPHSCFTLFFFFFLAFVSGANMSVIATVHEQQPQLLIIILCTVYGSHKLHFSAIFSLQMGYTVLFTHLKIILLQYFQFSVSTK